MSKRVCLGKIATAHGIKGFVKISVYAEDPRTIDQYGPLFTTEAGSDTITISLKSSTGKHWLASVDGITERNGAERLRNTELWVDRDRLPKLDEGRHYHADLANLPVRDQSGKELGRVITIANFGAGDLLEIQQGAAESFYLPFTKENIVKVEKDGITVNIPEGLL